MRILYWTKLFWPAIGGVEVHATHFLPALQERGHEFVVVTSHDRILLPDHDQYAGIPIYRFPFLAALETNNIQQLKQALQGVQLVKRQFKPDLIHLNFLEPSVFFHLQTAHVQPAPLLMTLHGGVIERYMQPGGTLVRALEGSTWLAGCSQDVLDHTLSFAPSMVPRSSVIHNGLAMPKVVPTTLPQQSPLILCLGRVVEDKGFDLTLRAFALLRERYLHVQLVIGGDGLARHQLEQLAEELGVRGNVRFLGWVIPEQVPDLMNKATIVVMPSRWREPFGLVALQAAQMARPIVAARVGGLPEIVRHGETGLLVPNEDVQAQADAIAWLLDHPEEATAMGCAARHRAETHFTLDQHAAAYDRLYRQLGADA